MTDYVDASDEKESAAAEIAEVSGTKMWRTDLTQGAKKRNFFLFKQQYNSHF